MSESKSHVLHLKRPAAGKLVELDKPLDTEQIVFEFGAGLRGAKRFGADLALSFEDSGTATLHNYFIVEKGGLPGFITAQGKEISAAKLLGALNPSINLQTLASEEVISGGGSGGGTYYFDEAGEMLAGVSRLGYNEHSADAHVPPPSAPAAGAAAIPSGGAESWSYTPAVKGGALLKQSLLSGDLVSDVAEPAMVKFGAYKLLLSHMEEQIGRAPGQEEVRGFMQAGADNYLDYIYNGTALNSVGALVKNCAEARNAMSGVSAESREGVAFSDGLKYRGLEGVDAFRQLLSDVKDSTGLEEPSLERISSYLAETASTGPGGSGGTFLQKIGESMIVAEPTELALQEEGGENLLLPGGDPLGDGKKVSGLVSSDPESDTAGLPRAPMLAKAEVTSAEGVEEQHESGQTGNGGDLAESGLDAAIDYHAAALTNGDEQEAMLRALVTAAVGG